MKRAIEDLDNRSDGGNEPRSEDVGLSPEVKRGIADIILETTSEGIWLIDADARTSFVNRHAAALLGRSQKEMLGMHLFEFTDEEGRRICERNLERRKAGILEQHEFKFLRKDGKAVWTLLSTNPILDSQGRYDGALAMVADISALKAAQEALREHSEQLEARILERTHALEEANARLQELAVRDGLTGLYNHRYAHERLEQEVSRARRSRSRLSVLLLDVDEFKAINDRHGHLEGDRILRVLGGLFMSDKAVVGETPTIRRSDIPTRYGGEEFLMICPDTPIAGAEILGERLRRRVEELPIPSSAGAHGVTISGGVAELMGATTKEELIACADSALYVAKRAGRNRVCVSDRVDPGGAV